MSKSGIVSVRMVITEEKILFNIDKIQKLINPKSKKQIVQLDDDMFFKDLIESVKTYLIEYPKKKNFPIAVYKAAYGLVEFATNQFEENTKKIEELIRQREQNIARASELENILDLIDIGDEAWQESVVKVQENFTEDIIDTLNIAGNSGDSDSQDYQDAVKLIKARVNNLESNLHIEIDMERIEDRSKALSYIGIEVADALKSIPAPLEDFSTKVHGTEEVVAQVTDTVETKTEVNVQENVAAIVEQETVEEQKQVFEQETTFVAKQSIWQKIKNSKFVRTIKAITKIRIKLDYSALPEGRGE